MVTSGGRPVRVFIVEDDAWLRDSLERALRWPGSNLEHVGSSNSGAQALALIADGLDTDVALIDMGLPDMRGSEVIRALRSSLPNAVPVVFTVHDDPAVIVEAIRSGALGYLLKSAPIQAVLDGLVSAADGGSPITPSVARLVIEALRSNDSFPDEPGREVLTSREAEVLTLLSKGLTYSRVAETLGIGLGTVQSHVKRIYEKLQVSSKAEAATSAQRMGLL